MGIGHVLPIRNEVDHRVPSGVQGIDKLSYGQLRGYFVGSIRT